MQPKLQRIFSKLQLAKAEGVQEIDILDDLETSNNARVIKHRLNKLLGRGSVTTKNGIWYLDKGYWEISPMEFRDIIIAYELSSTRKIVFWSMSAALIITLLLGLIIGLNYEIAFIWLD